jgi:hypothetical protein
MSGHEQDASRCRFIPGARVRLGQGQVRVSPPGKDHDAEPQVILIRDGDTVSAIEVICTCGQRIRLNCVF